MITIKNVSFAYDDVFIFEDINLTLDDNKIYGLIGKNGVGKTTFLKILTRFITTNQGDVYLDDVNITHTDFLDTSIAYVQDDSIVFNELTFSEHLNFIARSCGLSKREYVDFEEQYSKKLDLEHYLDCYPGTLSKGTMQRLNIGMNLIRQSPYLLMDEPFNGLDPVQIKNCLSFIKEYHEKLANTIVISSHQLEHLEDICDEYLIMTTKGIRNIAKEQINEQEIIEILNDDTVH